MTLRIPALCTFTYPEQSIPLHTPGLPVLQAPESSRAYQLQGTARLQLRLLWMFMFGRMKRKESQNIFLDYDKVATAIDSDGDTIDFHRYDMVLDYLTWKMWTILKNDGILDMNNNYYIQFKEKLNDSIRTSRSGQVFPWRPKINRINYRGGTGSYISSSDRSGSN